jgi:hypothetical protein
LHRILRKISRVFAVSHKLGRIKSDPALALIKPKEQKRSGKESAIQSRILSRKGPRRRSFEYLSWFNHPFYLFVSFYAVGWKSVHEKRTIPIV